MKRTEPLVELIFDRLATDHVPDETADLVLAALSSDDDLAAALAGRPTSLDPRPTGTDEPRGGHLALLGHRRRIPGRRPGAHPPIEPGPGHHRWWSAATAPASRASPRRWSWR